ncbi:hypothetical protein C7999DRAFT_30946 [Corynascus novoguineensis]|uniref:Uncharacterized protein n=1 Tax=Corynascus novoguineensis TaxID=1126955 RepID=A0AAN7HRM6_9PEZI|nr:hypothetical protein C7999DRAFT_30946 [Corynascus novoguineensis]
MATTPTDEPGLVGYKASSDRVSSRATLVRCDADRTRTVSSRYGTCCPLEGECSIPTACLAGTVFYEGSRSVCGSDSSCTSLTVLSRSASPLEIHAVDYFCEPTTTEFEFSTLYLQYPVPRTSGGATVPTTTTTAGKESAHDGDEKGHL